MKKLLVFILFILTIFFENNVNAQSLAELKKQKEEIEKEIKYLNDLIKKGEKNRNTSLGKLSALDRKIYVRHKLINNLEKEINLNNDLLKKNKDEVNRLTDNVIFLKNQYANVIYYSWKNRAPENKLIFLFSSESFNQAFKRLKYFKQYSDYTIKLSNKIERTNDSLIVVNNNLNKIIKDKSDLLEAHNAEKLVLFKEKESYKKLLKDLQSQEGKIRRKLEKQIKYQNKLSAEIKRIINLKNKNRKVTTVDKNLAKNFELNKGKLPWPTSSGYISSTFGLHAHPVSKRTKIRNDGIDITTKENGSCLSVFNGTVSEVFNFPGLNNIVMVRHGSFLTVYANLKTVFVRKGDNLKTGQPIGKIFTDPDDKKTVLKFQLWKESQKMDPQKWLRL